MMSHSTIYQALRVLGVALVTGTLLGCVGEDAAGEGSLALDVSGGAALRDGFPHTDGSAVHAFVDGWQLRFDTYVLAVGEVRLSEPGSGAEVQRWAGPKVMDLARSATASEPLTTLVGLSARRLDLGFSFVAPAELPTESSAATDDVQQMIDNGWSFLAAGEATHPASGRTVRFRLGLPAAARYEECLNGKDNTQGVAIEANKTTGAFIYAHAIHLFWDSLGAGDEDLRFDALAAVANDEGQVTEAELKKQDLTDLRNAVGDPLLDSQAKRVVYNDGGLLPPNQWSLYHFIEYAARASVHFNGTGLCKVRKLP